ncbi:hypothetical protein TNCT_482841, partial [Trichonephila clavata]
PGNGKNPRPDRPESKEQVNRAPVEEPRGETETAATAAVPLPLFLPNGENQKRRKTDADGFSPPAKHLIVRKPAQGPLLHPPLPCAFDRRSSCRRGNGRDPDNHFSTATVLRRKPRVPPFFVNPKGDWRQLIALAKIKALHFNRS